MLRVLAVASALVVVGAACDDTVFQTEVVTYEPTWFGVQVFLLDHCSSCHDGTISDAVFPEEIEDDLRDMGGKYVVAGEPEASMLWRVVIGELDANDPGIMPLGTGLLPRAQVEHIEEWILAGAPL